jgi:hypothetical protein
MQVCDVGHFVVPAAGLEELLAGEELCVADCECWVLCADVGFVGCELAALSRAPGLLPGLPPSLVFTSALITTMNNTATAASMTRNQAARRRRSDSVPGPVSTTRRPLTAALTSSSMTLRGEADVAQ